MILPKRKNCAVLVRKWPTGCRTNDCQVVPDTALTQKVLSDVGGSSSIFNRKAKDLFVDQTYPKSMKNRNAGGGNVQITTFNGDLPNTSPAINNKYKKIGGTTKIRIAKS